MLAPGGEFERRSLWSDLALESLAMYRDFVEELAAESDVSIDFRQCGAFDIAFTEAEAGALRARATKQNECRIYSEQFPPSRIPGLRDGSVAAQYFPGDAVVNPRDLVRALRVVLVRGGVRVREFEAVHDLGSLQDFDCYVVAAGAWSDQVAAKAVGGGRITLPKAVPIRGHLIAFEEDKGLCDPILRHGHTYLLRRANDMVIAGSSTENAGFDRQVDGAIAADIAAKAGALVPALHGRAYVTWNGIRPGSGSGEPVMGRLADTPVWLAYGHYRNGILLAPATARGIAREIVAADFTRANSQTDLLLPIGHRQ